MVTNGLAHAALLHLSGGNRHREGERLEECLEYVGENINFTRNFYERIPTIKMLEPEASFLIFLDCRDLGLYCHTALNDFFTKEAGLYLNDESDVWHRGRWIYATECGTATVGALTEALERLEKAQAQMKR